MMKISALFMAAALAASGAAFAQDHGKDARHHDGTVAASTADKSDKAGKGDGLLAKTERGLHRIGAKLRNAFHRDEHSNTKAMGASRGDNAERDARMKDAYGHEKEKQAK